MEEKEEISAILLLWFPLAHGEAVFRAKTAAHDNGQE